MMEEAERIHKQLAAEDSIMEPNVISLIPKFLKSGGTPQEIVQLLAESYRGKAQMCNLVSSWISITHGESEEGKENVHQMIEGHLKSLLLQRFDPKKADSIFSEGASSAPAWLETMIQQPRYRTMIYELSEEHKNCVLLNFAIQAISEAGHQAEITGIATASKYLDVFSRILVDSISQLKSEQDETILTEKLPEFAKMCSQEQHTYLFAQTLLHRLMREPGGYTMKRLSQELDLAVRHHGKAASSINFLLYGLQESAKIAQAIMSIVRSKASTPGDVLTLYQEYSSDKPPLIDYIQNPELIEILLNDLFGPSKNVNPIHKKKYFFLLACAVCFEPGTHSRFDLDKIQPTTNALETAEHIARTNPFGSELQASLIKICTCLEVPIVAKGMIYWIKHNLSDKDYYANNFTKSSTPIHLILLEEIAALHPLQREYVFQILTDQFEKEHMDLNSLLVGDLRKSILDKILCLVQLGFVFPVLKYIEVKAAQVDQALITHFLHSLLDRIEPPFSPEFITQIVRIVKFPPTKAALHSNHQMKSLLAEFLVNCREGTPNDSDRDGASELLNYFSKPYF